MNAGNWIELAALLVTIVGGGGISVSKLTRIAVGLEQLGKGFETLGGAIGSVQATVQAHSVTLAEHGQQLQQLQNKP